MSLRLKFAADTVNSPRWRQGRARLSARWKSAEMEAELMVLALDEACTNIIRHAYGGCSRRLIRCASTDCEACAMRAPRLWRDVRSRKNSQPRPRRLPPRRTRRAHHAQRVRSGAFRAPATRHTAHAGEGAGQGSLSLRRGNWSVPPDAAVARCAMLPSFVADIPSLRRAKRYRTPHAVARRSRRRRKRTSVRSSLRVRRRPESGSSSC